MDLNIDADIDSSIPETLENLSEEASGWLYGFFTLVYDIMTPFEIEEEEEQVGVATKEITGTLQATWLRKSPVESSGSCPPSHNPPGLETTALGCQSE